MINSYIALGYKCNHNCLNCPLTNEDRNRKELPKDIIIKHIAELSKNKENLHITISGGEPTLNDNFLDALKILSSNGCYISILSNASTCKDMDFVSKMLDSFAKDYDLNKFRYITAIHSYNKNVHDKLTGVIGSFEDTIKGLENLDKKNIHITIKIIMNKVTSKDMKETLKYLNNHFSDNIDFELCATDYDGRCYDNLDKLYINFEDLEPILEDTLDYYEQNIKNKNIRIIETPLCLTDPYYWKYYDLKNNINGLTYIAPNASSKEKKNVNTSSACHTNYKECTNCAVKKYCSGVWNSTYNIESNKQKIIRTIISQ